MVFFRFFRSTFPICSTILCTPIPIIYFSCFSTWGFHNHFIKVRYTTREPIRRSIFCPTTIVNLGANLTSFEYHEPLSHTRHKSLHQTNEN
jgi:hypothetical protein